MNGTQLDVRDLTAVLIITVRCFMSELLLRAGVGGCRFGKVGGLQGRSLVANDKARNSERFG